MGKKKKRIPKKRDIEELVAKEEGSEQVKDMQDIIEKIDSKEKEFRERMKVRDQELKKAIRKQVENHNKTKDAQWADEKRNIEYLKTIAKIMVEKEI